MCFQKVFFIDGISQTSLYFLLLSFIVIFTGFYYTSIWQKMQENNIFLSSFNFYPNFYINFQYIHSFAHFHHKQKEAFQWKIPS